MKERFQIKLVFLPIAVLLLNLNVAATHMSGGQITTHYVGDSVLEVRVKVYRDCQGAVLASLNDLSRICCENDTCSTKLSFNLVSIRTITPACLPQFYCIDPNKFNSGSNLGYEELYFIAHIDLKRKDFKYLLTCGSARISVEQCCRDQALTNTNYYNFYLETFVKLGEFMDNQNPVFYTDPMIFLCSNKGANFSVGAIDTKDGDSISYEIISPLVKRNEPITYNTGWNSHLPVTSYYVSGTKFPFTAPKATPPIGFYLSNKTGEVIFTPTNAGEVSVMSVMIKEWRKDKTDTMRNISKIQRDIGIIIENCSDNNLPQIGELNYNSICPYQSGYVRFEVTDVIGNKAQLSDTLKLKLFDSTGYFKLDVESIDYGKNQTKVFAKISWDKKLQNFDRDQISFAIRASDNHCPMNGLTWKLFNVSLKGPPRLVLQHSYQLIEGDSVQIGAHDADGQYVWNTGDSVARIYVKKEGTYRFEYTNKCGVYKDSVTICSVKADFLTLLDSTLCDGETINAKLNGYKNDVYGWSNGIADSTIKIKNGGHYYGLIQNKCGIRTERFYIDEVLRPDSTIQITNFLKYLCKGDTADLYLNTKTYDSVFWSTGQNSKQIKVHKSGTYSAIIKNICFTAFDTITVDSLGLPKPAIHASSDTICLGESVKLSVLNDPYTSYVWNNNVTDSFIIIQKAGKYKVKVTNKCGSDEDSLWIIGDTLKTAKIVSSDTFFCKNDSLLLKTQSLKNVNYLWSNGSEQASTYIKKPGRIKVAVRNYCGTTSDSVEISQLELPKVNIGNDTTITGSVTFTLDAGNNGSAFLWSTGERSQTIKRTLNYGVIWVRVTNQCGVTWDTLTVIQKTLGLHVFETSEYRLYPNPAGSQLNVEMSKGWFELLDLSGKQVLRAQVHESKSIDVGYLSRGMYMAVFHSEKGNHLVRIILE